MRSVTHDRLQAAVKAMFAKPAAERGNWRQDFYAAARSAYTKEDGDRDQYSKDAIAILDTEFRANLRSSVAYDEATKLPEEREAEAEHDAGYRAFMLSCAWYCLAHAAWYGDDKAGPHGTANDHWTTLHKLQRGDDKPVTDDYLDGYEEARARIQREGFVNFGGLGTPRETTAFYKKLEADGKWPPAPETIWREAA